MDNSSLRTLRVAYITAFCLIAALALGAQILIQVALYRETIARGAAALEARQSIRSQRIVRDAILLLTKGDHAANVAEMQRDVDGLEQDRQLLNARYIGYYPQFANLDGGHGHAIAVYLLLRATTLHLIATERRRLPEKARERAETSDIVTIFYKQPEQLSNIQAAQAIIDADIDSYIARIRGIELTLCVLTILTLVGEGLFVVRPAVRQLAKPL